MPRPPRRHQCDFVCICCRVRDCYDVLGHPDHLHICWTCYLEFDRLPRAAAISSAFAFEDLSGYATNIRSPDQQRHLARLVGTPSGNKPPKVSCKTLGLGNENASSASTSYARSEKGGKRSWQRSPKEATKKRIPDQQRPSARLVGTERRSRLGSLLQVHGGTIWRSRHHVCYCCRYLLVVDSTCEANEDSLHTRSEKGGKRSWQIPLKEARFGGISNLKEVQKSDGKNRQDPHERLRGLPTYRVTKIARSRRGLIGKKVRETEKQHEILTNSATSARLVEKTLKTQQDSTNSATSALPVGKNFENRSPDQQCHGGPLGWDNEEDIRGFLTNKATWPAWLRGAPDQQRLLARLVGKKSRETSNTEAPTNSAISARLVGTRRREGSPDQQRHLGPLGWDIEEDFRGLLINRATRLDCLRRNPDQQRLCARLVGKRPRETEHHHRRNPDQQRHPGPFGWEDSEDTENPTNSAASARLVGKRAREEVPDQQCQRARLVGRKLSETKHYRSPDQQRHLGPFGWEKDT